METRYIESIHKGKKTTSTLSYSTEAPWTLSIQTEDIFNVNIESDDLFNAFKEARVKAEKIDLFFLCNGARENVYPSSMTRSMAGGIAAYTLTMGKPASRKDLIKIFDGTNEPIASPEEQDKFYANWINSLK